MLDIRHSSSSTLLSPDVLQHIRHHDLNVIPASKRGTRAGRNIQHHITSIAPSVPHDLPPSQPASSPVNESNLIYMDM